MKAQGKIESITKPIRGGGYIVTVRIDALPEGLDGKLLDVTMVEHKTRRSNDANALMWACIGEISRVVKKEPFEVYLDELAKYGKYTYVVVKPDAVESMMKMWRECKIVGEIDINGISTTLYYKDYTYVGMKYLIWQNNDSVFVIYSNTELEILIKFAEGISENKGKEK